VVKKVVLLEPFFYIEKKCPIDGIFAVMIWSISNSNYFGHNSTVVKGQKKYINMRFKRVIFWVIKFFFYPELKSIDR
jgi:hypothetical protein